MRQKEVKDSEGSANPLWKQPVLKAFHGMKTAFENLVVKHEEYTQLIQDNEAFEEEKWLEECEDYLHMEIRQKIT